MVLVAPGCSRGCSGGTPKLANHCGTGAQWPAAPTSGLLCQ